MTNTLRVCAVVVASGLLAAQAEAAITNALWTFPATTTPAPASPIAANLMTYSVNDVLNWTAGGSHLTESYVSNPGRTTALEFSYAGNQASSMNNTTITLSTTITNLLTGSFLTGIQMSYETKWSNTGTPITQTWAYSLNGGAFTNFMVNSTSGNAWQTNSASFTGLQLQNGDTFVLRDTLTGASGNGQSLDFDDFMINSAGFAPVPEPSGVALLLTAGVAGLVVFRRTKPGQLH